MTNVYWGQVARVHTERGEVSNLACFDFGNGNKAVGQMIWRKRREDAETVQAKPILAFMESIRRILYMFDVSLPVDR